MWFTPPLPHPKPTPHYVQPAPHASTPAVRRVAQPAQAQGHPRPAAHRASLQGSTQFAYQGPLGGALRRVADHLGWQFSSIGRPAQINVLLTPHHGETWLGVLRQLGTEAGKAAVVSVNARSQTITAIYDDAPAALRREVYVPSGASTARKALLSIASQSGLMFVNHYHGQPLPVHVPGSAISWSDLRSIAGQIRGHARIAINLRAHTLTITGAHHA